MCSTTDIFLLWTAHFRFTWVTGSRNIYRLTNIPNIDNFCQMGLQNDEIHTINYYVLHLLSLPDIHLTIFNSIQHLGNLQNNMRAMMIPRKNKQMCRMISPAWLCSPWNGNKKKMKKFYINMQYSCRDMDSHKSWIQVWICLQLFEIKVLFINQVAFVIVLINWP